MEVQEITPLTKACLLPKGYLVIVGVGGARLNMWGVGSIPTDHEPSRVRRYAQDAVNAVAAMAALLQGNRVRPMAAAGPTTVAGSTTAKDVDDKVTMVV